MGTPRSGILTVVLWMTGALIAFCAMAVAVRALAGALSVMEILAVRSSLGLTAMLALAALRPDLRATVSSRRWPLHVLRNSVHLGGSYLWAMSLLLLPLATCFALEFTIPAWTLLLGVPFLGERLTAGRIGAVVLGLAGVLVIVRPGLQVFDPAMLLMLSAALALAVSLIATKMLTHTETSFAIILWMNAVQLPLALLASDPLFATRLGFAQAPAVAAIGVAGLASHYCLARAFHAGDAGVVVPLDFLRIPLIAVIGWWLYGETVDILVLLGAGLIIAGILWNLRSEARRSRHIAARAQEAPMG